MTKRSVSPARNIPKMARMVRFDYPADFCNPFGKSPLRPAECASGWAIPVRPSTRLQVISKALRGLYGGWHLRKRVARRGSTGSRCRVVSLPAPIPSIRKYWGEARDYDQRLVELAAIGFALRLAEEQLWQPLAAPEKERAL